MPATLSSAGLPTLRKAASDLRDVGLCNQLRKVHNGEERFDWQVAELTSIKRAVSNHSVDGLRDLGIAQLRFGALIFLFMAESWPPADFRACFSPRFLRSSSCFCAC